MGEKVKNAFFLCRARKRWSIATDTKGNKQRETLGPRQLSSNQLVANDSRMETGVAIIANKKAKQKHERVLLSGDDCYLIEDSHFCFAVAFVWRLWNPQRPVTQHSFCFITRTKACVTLFEIVCFRYNESNYSGCTKNRARTYTK